MRPRIGVRVVLVTLCCASTAAWAAGCSDDAGGGGGPPATAGDAAVDAPTIDDGPAADAGTDARVGRDCTKDDDLDGMKKHLDCTGLYQDFAAKVTAADVKTYSPALEFWSDGAEKQRFVYLPPGGKIDIASFDEWTFPEGTKLWKEFKLDGKRVETRLYEKTASGSWRHTVYRWNDAETEAVRKEAGEKLAPSGARTTTYEVPNTTQCNVCHDGRKEPVLGFDAIGLGLPGAKGVTLATLAAEGRFTSAPPKTALALPDDVGDGKAPAAIGWLHANCGSCHNASSGAAALFTKPKLLVRPSELLGDADAGTAPATVQTLATYTSTVCVESNRTDLDAGAPFVLVRGGDAASSLLSILSGRRVAEGEEPTSAVQMPPLVTRKVDAAGHAALDAWIAQLPACPN